MLADTFATLRSKGQKALILYVTAGDPSLEDLPAILDALAEGGADVIEVGLPFSDPIADGPTIQASTQRALDRGVTPSSVLSTLSHRSFSVPVVLMGYYNTILRRGLKEFASQAADCGVSGTILTDLSPEESEPWLNASKSAGLDTVFLAAPTSTDARLDAVCRCSSGFVYVVSRTGVTGAESTVGGDVSTLVERVKARTDLPVCVGFGISTPEHVREISKVADGAVIGSWLVNRLTDWQGGSGRASLVRDLREMKAATIL